MGAQMTLEEEIVEWSKTRPAWQRVALGRLARGEVLKIEDLKQIAARLVSGKAESGVPLSGDDLGGGAAGRQRVALRSVTAVANVNALVGDQRLTFDPSGLTVVYGDNASGKSGYARLIKSIVRARHREAVLTNIFTTSGAQSPEAVVCYEADGAEHEEPWPTTTALALTQVGFYDAACGNAYIRADTEITYRPSVLSLLDGLIQACGGVRDVVDKLLAANAAQQGALPLVASGTSSSGFLASLSARTTDEELEAACRLPEDSAQRLAALVQEESRLRATDPTKERARLEALASSMDGIGAHFRALEVVLGAEAIGTLQSARARAIELRAAAEIASSVSFESEPVQGVGSDTWRTLWDAARRFSESEAYHGDAFPVVASGARCVLCQQELSPAAAQRLERFQAFMQDHAEREAERAERTLETLVARARALNASPANVAVAITEVEVAEPQVASVCRDTVAAFELQHSAILSWLDDGAPLPYPLVTADAVLVQLGKAATERRAQALEIDGSRFDAALSETVKGRAELEARLVLAAAREAISNEVARRHARAQLDVAKRSTDTTGITRKSTELARAHVTSLVRDRFTRESDRLRLERVTLEDTGGHKGQLRQRPAFLGAVQRADMALVLSEGEKTALGLAGYLTEAFFDESHSAMVLDDPVTSLDHIRRTYVARRLAEFARDRQVIVFTHDVAFVGDLRRAADHEGVTITERSVERRGDGSPGVCVDMHPWKARDVRARLGKLAERLAQIKRDRTSWDQATFEKEAAEWAGMLSETWERAISMEVVNQVVDRATSEVHPRMFRMLARITEDDDREFQESYGRCSQWARRHDKSPEINWVPPRLEEMEAELALFRAWYDRIRRYGD
jgi:energy-coupling factor transporter ATP-binding protein EcfA2